MAAPPPAAAAKPAAPQKPKANVLVDQPATVTGRTGGVYIPPFKLAQMQRDAESLGKATKEYQRIAWEALRKSINGLINKARERVLILCTCSTKPKFSFFAALLSRYGRELRCTAFSWICWCVAFCFSTLVNNGGGIERSVVHTARGARCLG